MNEHFNLPCVIAGGETHIRKTTVGSSAMSAEPHR